MSKVQRAELPTRERILELAQLAREDGFRIENDQMFDDAGERCFALFPTLKEVRQLSRKVALDLGVTEDDILFAAVYANRKTED